MHIEAVTAGRETAANHLAYTLLCMFLVAAVTMYKEIILSVIKTSLLPMIILIVLQYIFKKHSTYLFIEYSIAYSCVRMLPLINSMHTLGIKGVLTLIVCFLFLNTSTLIMYRIRTHTKRRQLK